MLVEESFLEHKSMHETTDELDETLSLCDLPLYSDQSVEEWEQNLSADSLGSTSISSSDNDYFEFSSHELIPSTTCFPPENIIFCGKIISYKKPDASEPVPSKEQSTSIKKRRGWSMFRWSKTGKKKTTTLVQKKEHHQTSKKTYNAKKHGGKGYDLPLHKMSILTSSSSGKARWYLFFTGISRFSSGMELRDIKSRQRQSRRHRPPPTLRVENHEKKVTGKTSRSSSRMWEVIRVLSCGGNHHPNAMVVGSMRPE